MLLLMDNNDIDRISKNFTLAFFDERLWDGSVFGGGCQELRPLYIERHRGVRRQILATAHEHWELTVVADGQMTLYADRGVETDAGTSVLIPPGLSHLEYSAKEVDTYWLGFQAELPGVPGDKAMEVVSEGLQKRVEEFWSFSNRCSSAAGAELDGMTMTVVGHFFRRLKEGDARSRSLFQEAAERMNERFHESISMSDLAAERGCSLGHFQRQFKASAGITPLAYLNALRIKKAVFYLENTEFPVNQIGRLCGFENPYYFSRAFKKAMGVSPIHCRRSK